MKTVIFVICFVFVACGNSEPLPNFANPNDESRVYCIDDTGCATEDLCISSVCVPAANQEECWGDQDCPNNHRCIAGVCIEKPECMKDEDCSTRRFNCALGKCIDYIDKDSCDQKESQDECVQCGPYTVQSHTGLCTDACVYKKELEVLAWDSACSEPEQTNCPHCICWRSNQQEYYAYEDKCTPYAQSDCNFRSAEILKQHIESGEFSVETKKEDIIHICK